MELRLEKKRDRYSVKSLVLRDGKRSWCQDFDISMEYLFYWDNQRSMLKVRSTETGELIAYFIKVICLYY